MIVKKEIILVGDYLILRKGLKLLFEKDERFAVVGEVSGSEELFGVLSRICPDVVLLDLFFQPNQVMNLLRQMQRNFPQIPVVILAANASQGEVLDAVMLGAKGVIWKENSIENLLEAVMKVCSGQSYFAKHVTEPSTQNGNRLRVEISENESIPKLSARERQVLTLIAQGLSFKEIGNKLFISPRTVESHKNNLLSKLDLNNLVDLVKFAMRTNLID